MLTIYFLFHIFTEDVHFKHSASLAKTFIGTNANFQFKVRLE